VFQSTIHLLTKIARRIGTGSGIKYACVFSLSSEGQPLSIIGKRLVFSIPHPFSVSCVNPTCRGRFERLGFLSVI